VSAEKLLNHTTIINIKPEPIFTDPDTGDICRAFYAIHEDRKRRLLIRVTEEYAEDVLSNNSGLEDAKVILGNLLNNLVQKTKNQSSKFEREKDFLFSHA